MCYIKSLGICSISYQKNKGRKEPLSGCFWFVTEDESYGLIFLFEGTMTGTDEKFTPFYQCSRSEAGRGGEPPQEGPIRPKAPSATHTPPQSSHFKHRLVTSSRVVVTAAAAPQVLLCSTSPAF